MALRSVELCGQSCFPYSYSASLYKSPGLFSFLPHLSAASYVLLYKGWVCISYTVYKYYEPSKFTGSNHVIEVFSSLVFSQDLSSLVTKPLWYVHPSRYHTVHVIFIAINGLTFPGVPFQNSTVILYLIEPCLT